VALVRGEPTAPARRPAVFLEVYERMSRKIRNLVFASGVAVALLLVASSFIFSSTDPSTTTPVSPRPVPTPEASEPPRPVDASRIYAVPVPRLQGLPLNAAAGTHLELWVAWDPPITKAPRIHRLIRDVVLHEIVPAPLPEAPPTALLSVPDARITDLLYADRYGALSVTIAPEN
jgi:hypothetical protein